MQLYDMNFRGYKIHKGWRQSLNLDSSFLELNRAAIACNVLLYIMKQTQINKLLYSLIFIFIVYKIIYEKIYQNF